MVDYAALRNRLWDVNIEYSALLKTKTEVSLSRMAQLKAERKTLMALLGGETELRLVSDNPMLPVAHRQSA
jgi:hypothetical protein